MQQPTRHDRVQVYKPLLWAWLVGWFFVYGWMQGFLEGNGWAVVTESALLHLLIAGLLRVSTAATRYYQPEGLWRLGYLLVVTLVVGAFGVGVLQGLLIPYLTGKLPFMVQVDLPIVSLKSIYLVMQLLLLTLAGLLVYQWQSSDESVAHVKETERLARQVELSRLQQQLQPHFLFNALNSISALAGSDAKATRVMVGQLATFLRQTLEMGQPEMHTLAKEIETLSLYMAIEKVRFGDRLQFDYQELPAALPMEVPRLCLQPLLENAIKYGVYHTAGQVTIKLETQLADGYLRLELTNPFEAHWERASSGAGFGLSALRRRLFLLYGRQDLLEVHQQASQFVAVLLIPIKLG